MKKTVWFLFFVLQFYGMESSIPSRADVFQNFISEIFQTTTAGYVLLGHKPLDLDGFDSLRSHIPGSNLHRNSVLGLLCKEYLRDVETKDGWIFTIQQPTHSDTYELLIGNRSALIAAIKAHIELFQLKFGFDVKPNELVDQLEQLGFKALFGGEIALQGIVLGYGYENAISFERFVKGKYRTIDEFNDFTYYIPRSLSDCTMIPFSYHSNLPNNQKLIRLYQQDQKTIDTFVQKPDWSKKIFHSCFKKDKKFRCTTSKTFSIPQIIAWSIRESCSIYFSSQFIQGMKAAAEGKLLIEPQEFIYFNSFYRDDFLTANGRDNRIFSDRFFQTDSTPKTTLIPGRLAMRILREGTDVTQAIVHPQDGLFLYVIKTLEGKPIQGNFYLQDPAPILEKDLFPGLSYGVIGMHLGEEREIFVHPDLFYGTSFGEGKPVIIRISCHSILKPTFNAQPLSLVPVKMKHSPLSITTLEQFSTIQAEIQEWAGWQTWSHYKQKASLEEVVDLLELKHFSLTSNEMLDVLFFERELYIQEESRIKQLQKHRLMDESLPKSISQQNHIEEPLVTSIEQK